MDSGQLSLIYIDIAETRAELRERIARIMASKLSAVEVLGPTIAVFTDGNDERDAARAEDPDEGFLFYPYILAVEDAAHATPEAYKVGLDLLLQALALPGVRFVTAADDEPSLWNGGRWDGRGAPNTSGTQPPTSS